jgi:hypothetical protein
MLTRLKIAIRKWIDIEWFSNKRRDDAPVRRGMRTGGNIINFWQCIPLPFLRYAAEMLAAFFVAICWPTGGP